VYILSLNPDNSIRGSRIAPDGTEVPGDAVAVTEVLYQDYLTKAQQMRADKRADLPVYNDGVVEIPTDPRVVISLTLNKTAYSVNENVTISITLDDFPTFSGERMFNAFGELYRFDFVDGVATRSDINFLATGIYEFANTAEVKVSNPTTVTVFR